MTATVREAGARERHIKGKLTEITDPTMHNPNNYLTVLTETKWFFTVSSELWKPKSVETICLLKKINIKKYFWPNRKIFLGLRGGGERHTRTSISQPWPCPSHGNWIIKIGWDYLFVKADQYFDDFCEICCFKNLFLANRKIKVQQNACVSIL